MSLFLLSKMIQRQNPDDRQKLAGMSKMVAEAVRQLVSAAEALKGETSGSMGLSKGDRGGDMGVVKCERGVSIGLSKGERDELWVYLQVIGEVLLWVY